jgi:hypothetical protein
MPSEWIFTAVGLTFVFIGIPLVFLGVALFSRLRRGWTAKVIWRSLRCPSRLTAAQVGFLEKEDFLRDLKTVDAIYCSVLADPRRVDCGKECLRA